MSQLGSLLYIAAVIILFVLVNNCLSPTFPSFSWYRELGCGLAEGSNLEKKQCTDSIDHSQAHSFYHVNWNIN